VDVGVYVVGNYILGVCNYMLNVLDTFSMQAKRERKVRGEKSPIGGIPYFDTLDPGLVRSKQGVYVDSGLGGHDMISDGFDIGGTKASKRATRFVAEQRRRLHKLGTARRRQLTSARLHRYNPRVLVMFWKEFASELLDLTCFRFVPQRWSGRV
jgi:hypothetical protein